MLGLSQAVDLNNQAVTQLQSGELKQATNTLRQAVATIRQVVCERQRQDESLSLSASQASTTTTTTSTELSNLPLDHPKSSSSAHILSERNSVLDASFSSFAHDGNDSNMDADDDNDNLKAGIESVQTMPGSTADDGSLYLSIYDHAFFINQGEERDELICTVIFYNLALVQHKRNMTHGRNLYKVLSIYQRAETVAQNLPYHDDAMILLLLLAVNNNKMQIQAPLFDRSSLQGSIMQMKFLVAERPSEDDLRFDFFVLNSICFAEEKWRCAPVA